MNPAAWLGAAKAWTLGGLIALLASSAAVQTIRLAGSREQLAEERRDRAQVDADRTRVALADALRTSEMMAVHAAAQQGLTSELVKETAARKLAERDNGLLAGRLRDAFKDFAARDRSAAEAHAAEPGDPGDRPDFVESLLAEAGELLARSGDLQEEARSIVTRRDSEVKALKAQVDVDRGAIGESERSK
jgi:hypothetical protein